MTIAFDNSYARLPAHFFARVSPTKVPEPRIVRVNHSLAELIGFDVAGGAQMFAGNALPEGADPIALAYAGHQFGSFVPQLGDGRAILIGEVVGKDGKRRDIQLKGGGRTPFSRRGDGRAALGPVLREYIVSEAMAALGVPTTRALAAVTTGESVVREEVQPGAVFTRVAASHIRVGTFEFFAARDDRDALVTLASYALKRHYPEAAGGGNDALALLECVIDAQARLVARWLGVGFVHGVMNTDNTTISGETIDYGPCAFLDAFDPAASFSSIDHAGRYAFGNQPQILQWNLTRLAETLLPLIDADQDIAVAQVTEILEDYPARFGRAWQSGMAAKLGLSPGGGADGGADGDRALMDDWLRLLHEHHLDHTRSFRALSDSVRHERAPALPELEPDIEPDNRAARAAVEAWSERHRARLVAEGGDPAATAAAMDRANPIYVPRNHLVEEALTAATSGDLTPFTSLIEAISNPFEERPGLQRYAEPAPADFGQYQTFCGT